MSTSFYSEGIQGNIRIYLVFKNRYIQLQFSDVVEGKYYLSDYLDSDKKSIIYLENKDQNWFLGSNKDKQIYTSDMSNTMYTQILDCQKYLLCVGGEKCVIFPEKINYYDNVFHNYQIIGSEKITIGRSNDNDIVCDNSNVSRHHAIIYIKYNHFYIKDTESANGTYVNGRRIAERMLKPGDVIFTLGLKIIVGVGFLSINDGDKNVYLGKKFSPYDIESCTNNSVIPKEAFKKEDAVFNRLPREIMKLDVPEIIIDDPPLSLNSEQVPMILRMGGSMVMGGTAMMRGNYSTLISMLLFPILNHLYSDKDKKKYESLRIEKYTEYLKTVKNSIIEEKEREEALLNKYYPATERVLSYPLTKKHLWERSYRHDDFLSIRIGIGELPLKATLSYNEKRFSLDEDPMEELKENLIAEKYYLSDVPVLLPLRENNICGIMGTEDQKRNFFLKLLTQLCFLHSCDEVKLVLLLNNDVLKQFPFLRYIPHVWNDDRSFRFLATDLPSSYLISEQLGKIIDLDNKNVYELKDILKNRPYYVVLAWNKQLLENIEILKTIIKENNNYGISIVTFFDDILQQSKEIIQLNQNGINTITYLSECNVDGKDFQMDDIDIEYASKMFYALANIPLKVDKSSYVLPKMITFLELYKVGRIEYLNPLKRWRDNNPIKSLAVPVGVSTDGSPFMLDLHEKYQGPHGLIAGMTGSGKSEFIITYILSLAINFHPDEVAFLLIDYKGGGLAGAFENEEKNIHLPHLVGTITNLDGSSITRALMSIESELKRRQRVFNTAKLVHGEGTMDIYTYQKLYRSGKVDKPLPHLFIIADEFAELKSQEPEFMDQLISAARIGRSLGVHLILATQKPAGVVNDQINSNSKFRVCLKVQTRADSDEMLRRPEAAEIKETGRFYLQVGYNEYFALGQSAWCGAPYEPQEEVIEHKDDYIQFIDDAGQNIIQVRPVVQKEENQSSQVVSIVSYLSELAERENIKTQKLWMPPLMQDYSLQELQEQYPGDRNTLSVTIGIIDDPQRQKQYPYILDLGRCQNMLIIGGNQTGKSTILQTLLYALMYNFSPEDVNFYIVDFSGGQLKIFENTRYCGGVWSEGQEEKIEKFFELLNEIIDERKKIFQQVGVSNFETYKEIAKLPLIVVLLDNFVGMLSWKNGKAITYELNKIIREGNTVGIKFIVTANSYDDVTYNVKKELRTRIVLDAKNRFEYGDILGIYCRFEPAAIPGRCFVRIEDQILECQIGRFLYGHTEQQRLSNLKQKVDDITSKYLHLPKVPGIVEISEKETYTDFYAGFSPKRIPLGYSVNDVKKISIPLKQLFCASIYLGNPSNTANIISNYLYAAINNKMELIIVKQNDNSIFEEERIKKMLSLYSSIRWYDSSLESLNRLKYIIYDMICNRKMLRNEYCEEKGLSPTGSETMKYCFEHIYSNSIPILILFENFAECCLLAAQDRQVIEFYEKVFKDGKGYNFYFIGFNYPDDSVNVKNNPAFVSFNKNALLLLYGGQYHKQSLCNLPLEYRNIIQPLKKAGACVMQYHSQLYQIWMPCYEAQQVQIDPDDEDII